jgi:hypothetical protein
MAYYIPKKDELQKIGFVQKVFEGVEYLVFREDQNNLEAQAIVYVPRHLTWDYWDGETSYSLDRPKNINEVTKIIKDCFGIEGE